MRLRAGLTFAESISAAWSWSREEGEERFRGGLLGSLIGEEKGGLEEGEGEALVGVIKEALASLD